MGKLTKISWCESTWNPVTGCKHGCEYCYARHIAQRFGHYDGSFTLAAPCERNVGTASAPLFELDEQRQKHVNKSASRKLAYPFGFEPTFHQYKLDEPQQWEKSRNIFVCSMADLFGSWVPDDWISEVFAACLKAPQHRYLFLTKNPQRYLDLDLNGLLPTFDNMWFGTTVTEPNQPFYWSKSQHTFLSIEPMQERFSAVESVELKNVDWIIVGAETGNRKGKIIPPYVWIFELAVACEMRNRPLFMKDSIGRIMPGKLIKKYPWTE